MFSVSKLYFRVYDGAGQLLVSTQSFPLAKAVFYSADTAKGSCRFFVGGYAEDVEAFVSSL